MKLHHTKHHNAYVQGLNVAEEKYSSTTDVKQRIILQAALKFNGGGAASVGSFQFIPSLG